MKKLLLLGTMLETTEGIKFVQCSLPYTLQNEQRMLYWLNDELLNDQFYWDHELAKILVKIEEDENE